MRSACLLLVVLVAACGDGTASELLGGRPSPTPGAAPTGSTDADASTEAPGPDGSGDDAGSGNDGGSGADSGTSADAGAPVNAFTGAAAFVAQAGPSAIKGQADHPFAGGNPAKQNCLDSNCHGPGGGGPLFAAGGTVFTDLAGTLPAAQVEVRIRDDQGDAVIAHTDANGNFFIRASQATNLAFPARVAVRSATTTKLMSGTIANGACSSAACHGAAATGVVHLP